MKTFGEVVREEFKAVYVQNRPDIPYRSFKFGKDEEYELAIEPLIYGDFSIALYHKGNLLFTKLPVKPINVPEE